MCGVLGGEDSPTGAVEGGATADAMRSALCGHATDLIARWLDIEVGAYLESHAALRAPGGGPMVVRNGFRPARNLMTSLGTVQVRMPKTRSHGYPVRAFHSRLVPPYQRRARSVARNEPARYLLAWLRADWSRLFADLLGVDERQVPIAPEEVAAAGWIRKGPNMVFRADMKGLWSDVRLQVASLSALPDLDAGERAPTHLLVLLARRIEPVWELLACNLVEGPPCGACARLLSTLVESGGLMLERTCPQAGSRSVCRHAGTARVACPANPIHHI
jgi:hypothetical protein